MTQNRYSLSDSDMLGIFGAIASVEHSGNLLLVAVKETWNAILAQEGLSWDSFDGVTTFFSPGDYAIPADQLSELSEHVKKRAFDLGMSDIGVTNLLMEYIVQYGPSTYTDNPTN